jgi:hypothetical protein
MTFNEWFQKCFIPEVEEYLAKGGLPLKVFLMIDNAPGQPHSISIEDKNVQVVFLPPITTALLQPLDQGIIRCVTTAYDRQVFEMIRTAIDVDLNFQDMDCWEFFGIPDAITFIKTTMDELKSEMVNECWKNLWNEAVNVFKGFPGIDREDHTISKRSWWRRIRRHDR